MGQIIENNLHVFPLNYAALKSEVSISKPHTGIIWRMLDRSIRGLFIHLRCKMTLSLDPEDPGCKDQNLLELGNPKHAFNWDVSLKHGPVTFGYQLRHFSKMAVGAIENISSVQGRPPQDADAFPTDYFSVRTYHDARVEMDVCSGSISALASNNITNGFRHRASPASRMKAGSTTILAGSFTPARSPAS